MAEHQTTIRGLMELLARESAQDEVGEVMVEINAGDYASCIVFVDSDGDLIVSPNTLRPGS
jgi:hypothetical protein